MLKNKGDLSTFKLFQAVMNDIKELRMTLLTTLMTQGHSHYMSKAGIEQLCKKGDGHQYSTFDIAVLLSLDC